MSFLGWMGLCGGLLLSMALSSAYLRRLPISTSAIYLAAGVAIGPLGFGWLWLDLRESAAWLERLTEVAVVVSLFIGGLKLRLPLRDTAWTAAFLLAGPVMLACIAAVALFAHFVLNLDIALALALGAILAPTDPVLASAVTVNDAADEDRVRYALSGEAGLNDGMAFPFVVLALLWGEHAESGGWLLGWALHRLLWAIPAALLLGFVLGQGTGRVAIGLRSRHRDTDAPSDFLALALIALSYVGAELIGAWGFLAVFAAGVGLRHAELKVVHDTPHPEAFPGASTPHSAVHPPAEHLVAAKIDGEALQDPAVAAGVLVAETISFGDTLERLLEVLLVVLVGVCTAVHWDARAVPLALALFVVVRPLAAWLLLAPTALTRPQRWVLGWFGIRGVGSLYYLSYVLNHGITGQRATDACNLVISSVALSILLHGVTTQPFLDRYERTLARAEARRQGRGTPLDPAADQGAGTFSRPAGA